jgi:hypothetical protein
MYYMNTDRDNFHDWHRDKPDTTSFATLHRHEALTQRRRANRRWRSWAFFVVVGMALLIGYRYLGH